MFQYEIEKINEQNNFLNDQVENSIDACKQLLLKHDTTEFANENVE